MRADCVGTMARRCCHYHASGDLVNLVHRRGKSVSRRLGRRPSHSGAIRGSQEGIPPKDS